VGEDVKLQEDREPVGNQLKLLSRCLQPARGESADRLSVIMIGVDLNVMLPLIGHVFVTIDRFDGTGRLAGAAIYTLVRMYKKLF
jgi:hypothetical protein